MKTPDIRQHPAYQYNETFIRYAPLACVICGTSAFCFCESPDRYATPLAAMLLAALFHTLKQLILPRVRTLGQLNLMTLVCYLVVFAIIWIHVAVGAAASGSPVVAACVMVVAGALLESRRTFVFSVVLGTLSWMAAKWMSAQDLNDEDLQLLLVFVPVMATLIRLALERTHTAVRAVQQREHDTAEELRTTIRRLNRENAKAA